MINIIASDIGDYNKELMSIRMNTLEMHKYNIVKRNEFLKKTIVLLNFSLLL